MRIFENLNVDFMGKRKLFYLISALLFITGFSFILIRGLEFGIDFKGGTEIALGFEKEVEIADIRNYVRNMGLGDVEVKTFGNENGVLIRTELQEIPSGLFPRVAQSIENTISRFYPGLPYQAVDTTINSITFQLPSADTTTILVEKLFNEGFQSGRVSDEASNNRMIVRVGIADWIKENLKSKMPDNSFQVLREERVGPKIGQELKTKAVLAVLLSLVVILIYLAFRFKFIFALGAVLALFHDVLITLGLYAIFYDVLPINLEISITVIAAFLTLVGYSINDTVVVFDRVREYIKLHKTVPLEENMNKAINRTMSRTILTGGTTLISVLVLLLVGGEVLSAFAFTLFFGIIIGTYSSIFVASAIVLDYAQKMKSKVQF